MQLHAPARPDGKPAFSFEILPPLKGNSILKVYSTIDRLKIFNPSCINITSHHSECVYREQPDGSLRRVSVRKRPGTVAIAAAIQNKYGIKAVPHIICKGFSKEETEYALLDLNFLGITNLLLLRGDSKSADTMNQDPRLFHQHATDLQEQVNLFNNGRSLDGTPLEGVETPFLYGMACYPEKHEEAPNMDSDLFWLKRKVENGASYLVSQLFYDTPKFLAFCRRCREAGIDVPIIPGIKPITRASQLTVLPKVFRTDIPEELASAVRAAKSDEDVKEIGVEWTVNQCRELMEGGVQGLHFYTYGATESVYRIASRIY